MIVAWTLIVLSAAWVGFAYVGYPLALALWARKRSNPVVRDDVAPSLAVIIAAHNGAHLLKRKLEATLALSYPEPFEVIVASDASTDGTDEIALEMADRGVRLVRSEPRRGKEAAQAAAIRATSADVLVMTDVGAELSRDALQQIVRPFADPTVGSVSSEDRVENEGGEGTYVKLEMAMRRWESDATTLVGLSGSFFAVRRELCDPWPAELASDFRTALETARRGMRAVSEPSATASFRATEDPVREWHRKVRTVRRGIAVLLAYRSMLHPRHGRAAFSLWGHKLARFTAPFALVLLLVTSAIAAPTSVLAAALLVAQLAAYAVAGLALWRPALADFGPARLLAFFTLVNASMLVAWGYHLSGRRAVTWEPTRR